MKRKTLTIGNRTIQTMKFSTREAADRYIARKGGTVVYFRAHEYYVEILCD